MLIYENYIFTYILRFKNCFNKLLYKPLLITDDGLGFPKYWDCTREGKEHEAEMGGLESSCGWTKSQFVQLIVLISKLWNVACFSSHPALFWGLNKKLKWTCREYYNVTNGNVIAVDDDGDDDDVRIAVPYNLDQIILPKKHNSKK